MMQSAPSDHTDIRRLQLERLTGVSESEPSTVVVEGEFE